MSTSTLNLSQNYIDLINDGLIILPDKSLNKTISDLNEIKYSKRLSEGETNEVELNAKKVKITSRGSLREIAIDGIHYDSVEQAACSMYDPYDKYYDISKEIRENILDFSFIPILDDDKNELRYTISKYSKGLKKYFDPTKVIKAVYTMHNILFYVKDEDDIRKKIYFKIGSVSAKDMLPHFCKAAATKNGINKDIYIAFFIKEPDLPFTYGTCKEDFYLLKDILNKIVFKGSTPLKYMILENLHNKSHLNLKAKEKIAYDVAIQLENMTINDFCNLLNAPIEDYRKFIDDNLTDYTCSNETKLSRILINKKLNIIENIHELKFYESQNLIWKVKFEDIPNEN